MKEKSDVVRGSRFVAHEGGCNGRDARCPSGPRQARPLPWWRSRRSATLPQKWALYREAKRRLEHGVPVDVLIRDVTMKLRMMGGAQ